MCHRAGILTGWKSGRGIPKLEPLEGFESGWEDWYTDHGVWQVGAPTTGPGSAYEGSSAAGTNLGGNYPDNTDSRLISPVFDLPDVGAGEVLQLRFWQWYSYAYEDRGDVQISAWDGNAWSGWVTLLNSAQRDANSGWSRVGVDLTAYADQRVRIAFYHVESNSYVSSGWYIDGVEIWQGIPKLEPLEGFESGWEDWYTDHGVWQVGAPTTGPGSAYEGSSAAGTNLGGNYPDNTDSRLISPVFDLPDVGAGEVLQLRFWQWYSYAYEDRGDVQISVWNEDDWGDWMTLLTSAQQDDRSDWSRVGLDLTAYADQRVRIAFYHVESNSYVSLGWYIDNVQLISTTDEDTDGDGMPNAWETEHGLDPNNPDDAGYDSDNDGLANVFEFENDTDPENPDTDEDGLPDGWEVNYGLDPKDDGTIDPNNGCDGDPDDDGLTNCDEYAYGLDPGKEETGEVALAPEMHTISIGGSVQYLVTVANTIFKTGYLSAVNRWP